MSSLQKKYNDWLDSGGDSIIFFAKNNLLGDKQEKLRQELEENYQALQEKRSKDPKERLKIISKRIKNYRQHENDAYVYGPGEIKEVRTLLNHAPEDIEFLLECNEQLCKRVKNLFYELRNVNSRRRKRR